MFRKAIRWGFVEKNPCIDVEQNQEKPSDRSSEYLVVNSFGEKYGSSGIQTAWQRLKVNCTESGIIHERFTFRDIRAKARSDGDDKKLLGHANPEAMAKIYQRKPVKVKPVK